jgi:gliding motility-associated-like protein
MHQKKWQQRYWAHLQTGVLMMSLVFICSHSFGQLGIQLVGSDIEDAINSDLGLSGTSVSAVSFFGDPVQVGRFSGGLNQIGIGEGMVLSTHDARYPDESWDIAEGITSGLFIPGSSPIDVSLAMEDWLDVHNSITSSPIEFAFDVVSLSFDLVVMGDSLVFEAVLAAQEYANYADGDFAEYSNDLFTVFISGPGLSGPYSSPAPFPAGALNMAEMENGTLPGSAVPISPYSVDPLLNADNSVVPLNNVAGYSDVMRFAQAVECGETYHINFLIADHADPLRDSFVFLRCLGETNEATLVDWEILGFGDDQEVLYEGCGEGQFTFHRPVSSPIAEALTIDVAFAGNASMGVDCSLLPSEIVFAPGEEEVVWSGIEAFADVLMEGEEELVLILNNPSACGSNGGINSYSIALSDGPEPVEVTFSEARICPGDNAVIQAVVTGGYGIFDFLWCDGSNSESLFVNNAQETVFCELQLSDTCGAGSTTWNAQIEVLPNPTIAAGPDQILCETDFGLGGEIFNLPVADCSEAAGPQVHCYGNNNNYDVLTYCPDDLGSGTFMTLSFLSGSVDTSDFFWIYDGDDVTAAPLAGPLSGDLSGLSFTAQNAQGCISILIQSNQISSCQDGGQVPLNFVVGCTNLGGYNVTWSPADLFSDPNDLNATISVLDSVEATLTVQLAHAPFCSSVDSVHFSPSLDYTVSFSNPTCFDPDGIIQVDVDPIGHEVNAMVSLSSSGAVLAMQNVFEGLASFDGLLAGEYVINIDNGFCSYEEYVELLAQPEATISLSPDTSICVGGEALLSAVNLMPSINLEWVWSNGFTQSDQGVSPDSTTIYTVFGTLIPGCNTATQSVTVTVFDSLHFDLVSDWSLCLGDSLFIQATGANGGLEPYAWGWESNSFFDQPQDGLPGQFVAPTIPTEYCITLNDACESPDYTACTAVDVPADIDPSFTANVVSGCFPLEVVFNGVTEVPESIATATWDFGDGFTSSDIDSTTHFYQDIGWYVVSYSITTDLGCEFSLASTDSIRVNPWPIAEFAADPWKQTLPNRRVTFTNYSHGAVNYVWNFAGLGTSEELEPVFYFPESNGGEYPVTLTAENEWGCADSASYFVWIEDSFALYAPNVFTPDNDGVNDAWKVVATDVDRSNYHLKVYNRWGQLVFESVDLEEAWTGNVQSGDYFAANDTYLYEIELRSVSTGLDHRISGHVTLLR